MGEHKVYLDSKKGILSGGQVARIDDSGRILVPSTWFSEEVVAYLRDDGIYISGPGFMSLTRVAQIEGNRIYSVADKGWFTYGTLVGSIDEDGTIRDASDRKVGEISGGSPLKQKSEVGGTGETPVLSMTVAAILIIAILSFPIMIEIAWMSNMSVFSNPVSALCGALFLICGTAIGIKVTRNNKTKATFGEVLSSSAAFYLIPAALFLLFILVFDNPIPFSIEYYGTLYGGLLLIIGFVIVVPLFLLVVVLPIMLVQALVTVLLKKNIQKNRLEK